jgi:hypothetical protein
VLLAQRKVDRILSRQFPFWFSRPRIFVTSPIFFTPNAASHWRTPK